ncbi:hypothetical protein MARI_12520 [Marinobacter sp. JH2]|uniref:hypothetical protein n=1 Tax=Marinobacter sp. AL4B TaxID=2871173 RepID=UPI001056714E|nr:MULTISPECIES: hypothetical protein [unclassified Marinobacter]MBZ0333637.1 hypothetical protein [Marinobacter sp. AL4B]QBM17146.1 hypothetical protein MARI_12520 [Marinobacter sp. JH2]
MFGIKKHALVATFSLFTLGASVSLAQGLPEHGPLADGKISEVELAGILATAQQQLIRLSDTATDEYQGALLDSEPNEPVAWMLMKDGETVKRLNLDSQVEGMPAAAKISVYRAAFKSVARKGEINAAAILYTGRLSEENETEVLVIEHEHRLGVSGNKVIGYEVEGGDIAWAAPVTQTKPFQWFYDAKEDAS